MNHTHHIILNITKKNYDIIVSLISIAAMSLLCVYPFLYYRKLLVSHDITFHLFQSVQFYKSIMSGTLIPRWAMETNNGYGSANFIFYSPISYYVICFFKLFMSSLILSMISAICISYLLSGISMFFVIRGYVNTKIALLCALLYQIFPFHMIDLYLRGAVAELFAFVWFPIIFKYLNEMFVSGRARVAGIWLSLSYAGLVMTHLVSAFIFMILIILYCLVQLFVSIKKENVIYVVMWILLSMGIVSYHIIPIVFEQKYVHIDYILKYTFGDYRKTSYLICLIYQLVG